MSWLKHVRGSIPVWVVSIPSVAAQFGLLPPFIKPDCAEAPTSCVQLLFEFPQRFTKVVRVFGKHHLACGKAHGAEPARKPTGSPSAHRAVLDGHFDDVSRDSLVRSQWHETAETVTSFVFSPSSGIVKVFVAHHLFIDLARHHGCVSDALT